MPKDRTALEAAARAIARRNFPSGTDRDIDMMWEGYLPDAEVAVAAYLSMVAYFATTRAENATLKAREVGYVQAMDAMGEELAAKDAALREALALMRGEPDMSLPGSDHWLWAKKVRELIGEGETA